MSILAEVIMNRKGSVKKLSLVKSPAVGIDFLKLKEEQPELKMAVDSERQNCTGPVLIPDKYYYRKAEFFNDESGQDGYIFFSKDTVREIGMDLLRFGNNINLDHKDDVGKEAVELVESWLIETTNDKAYDLGFTQEQCPQGTLMQTQHINDEKIWSDVKAGKYNGFSIQGTPAIRLLASGIELEKQLSEDDIVNIVVDIIKNYKE